MEILVNDLNKSVFALSVVVLGFSFLVLPILVFLPAPYGRYYDVKKSILFRGTVPARVGWVLMELPNLAIPAYLFWVTFQLSWYTVPKTNLLLISMYTVHYVYRTLIYPFLQTSRPHTFLSFLSALSFTSINGFIQGSSLLKLHHYSDEWLLQLNFIAGAFLWGAGLLINIYSDHILRNLRKPGETGYKIPQGFLYEYVSCANFFGEITEWLGFALACWNMASLSFFVFTFTNLVPRGVSHHRYYKEKFEDYPKNRKAIIPFLL